MKEAQYYKKLENNRVHCILCPRNCVIKPGHRGFCGVRKNEEGKLYSLIWSKVTALALDPVEKKPLYHFYPGESVLSLGTWGCNLRCLHCQNWQISHHNPTLDDEERILLPEDVAALLKKYKCSLLAWTYNEPAVWFEYIKDTALVCREQGVKTILVTSGMISPDPLKELLPLTDAFRVDIKGFSEEFYKKLTGFPALKYVLENTLTAYRAGLHVEVITNVIPHWNDSEEHLRGIASWIRDNLDSEVPWHVTAYHPAFQLSEPATPPATLQKAWETGHKAGLKHIYIGNVPGNEHQETLCPHCSEVIVKRMGFRLNGVSVKKGKCLYCHKTLSHFIQE